MVATVIDLPDELRQQIEELARQTGRAKADLLREAIATFMRTRRVPRYRRVAGGELAPRVITLDISAWFARLNRRDPDRDRVIRAMASEPAPWIVPAAILGEFDYLITSRGTPAALDSLLQDLEEGTYVLDADAVDVARTRGLVRRYADLPLAFVDAMVIACAERNGGRVATLDLRHFGVVAREGTITIVPPQ